MLEKYMAVSNYLNIYLIKWFKTILDLILALKHSKKLYIIKIFL
jgi:hypothetical protein